jgi:NADH dehydrogenase FAD-containing subunit
MPTDFKNVVVVGIGLGGANVIKALDSTLPASHRMIAISEDEYAYFPVASIRAATVPGWENKATGDARKFFAGGSRHLVLPGTKVLKINNNSVEIDRTHPDFGTEISFDVLVYCTGSTYSFPFRPISGQSTLKEIRASFRGFQEGIKNASSILIVGGGPTGAEFAGEIAAQHKGKKITLAHSGSYPLDGGYWKERAGQNLASQLRDFKVTLESHARVDTKGLANGPITKQTFDLGNGGTAIADFLITAHGLKPRSQLIAAFRPETVDAAGFVKVKPTMQVLTKDGSLDHIFAVGDVNDADRSKQAVGADSQGNLAAANIVTYLSGKNSLKLYKPAGPLGVFALGPAAGVGQIYFGLVVGNMLSARIKSKELFTDEFLETFEH